MRAWAAGFLVVSCVCAQPVPRPDGGGGSGGGDPFDDAGCPPISRDPGCDAGMHWFGGRCTTECLECRGDCPTGFRCQQSSVCSGWCVSVPAPCSGREVHKVVVELVATLSPLWAHELTRDSGTIACSGPDAGPWLVDAGPLSFAAFDEAGCLRASDLLSGSCIDHSAGVVATFDGDAGFEYSLGSGRQPSPEFDETVRAVFRACAPVFRDAGAYPFTW